MFTVGSSTPAFPALSLLQSHLRLAQCMEWFTICIALCIVQYLLYVCTIHYMYCRVFIPSQENDEYNMKIIFCAKFSCKLTLELRFTKLLLLNSNKQIIGKKMNDLELTELWTVEEVEIIHV